MTDANAHQILPPGYGHPAEIVTPRGAAPICLVCEHASAAIPPAMRDLGLAEAERYSHAAWDIGAEALARDLSQRLDAPLIVARVSRLVYDLNRPPTAPDAMPAQSGEVTVPGNRDLSQAERDARAAEVYEPFHDALSKLLDGFDRPPAFVTIHSFTPVWNGEARGTEIGLLHDEDARLANAMLDHADPGLMTELNAPYSARDGVTHTLRRHAIARGLDNVMIEVRNDLLGTEAARQRIAQVVERMLRAALDREDSAA